MDASDMYFLARYLLAAARQTIVPMADGRLSGTERMVLEDLVEFAPTTAIEVSRRTRIAQSRVSTIFAEWRARGGVEARMDPEDRRKTLLAPSDDLKRQYLAGALAGADEVLARLGVDLDAKEQETVLAAFDLLHRRLRPDHA